MLSIVMSTPGTSTTNRFAPQVHDASVRAKTQGSLQRFQRASESLAGGVSSGLRRSARPYPLFFTHGVGSRVFDVDGNEYVDHTLAWGPLIMGHAHPEIVRAAQDAATRAFTFGAQHDLEYKVAERLVEAIPCADLVSFANSGTEIVQVALRLARAVTGRTKRQRRIRHPVAADVAPHPLAYFEPINDAVIFLVPYRSDRRRR